MGADRGSCIPPRSSSEPSTQSPSPATCNAPNKSYIVGTGEFGNGEKLSVIAHFERVSEEQIVQASGLSSSALTSDKPLKQFTHL